MSVTFAVSHNIGEISLPDPSAGCLSRNDLRELAAILMELDQNGDVQAIVLLGGEEDFCKGIELAEFADDSLLPDLSDVLQSAFLALAERNKPIFAAVRGQASGFGLTLLCHAEYVVAERSALFAAPFVGLGLVPEAGSTSLLPDRIGELHAFRLLCLGEQYSAEEAQRFGMVSKLTDEDANEHARSMARRFAKQPAGAQRATRALLADRQLPMAPRIRSEILESWNQLALGGSRHLLRRLVRRNTRAHNPRAVA